MIRLEQRADPGEGSVLVPFLKPLSVGQGTWATQIGAYFLGIQINNTATHANGDNCTFNVYLAEGTYTIQIVGYQNTDKCILDIDLDGVTAATFDWFGANVPNTTKEAAAVVVSASGLKALRLKVDGKNGGSSNYYIQVSGIVFQRTA